MEFCKVSRHQKVLQRHLRRFSTTYPNPESCPEDLPKTFLDPTPETETPTNDLWVPKFHQLIGNTPIVDLTSLLCVDHLEKFPNVRIVAKCEFLNPGMSMKDRAMWNMLKDAQKSKDLVRGMTVISILWSNNDDTGAATAMVCAMQHFSCVIVCHRGVCSETKLQTIKAFGAEVIELDETEDLKGFVNNTIKSKLQDEGKEYYFIDKYNNESVVDTYFEEFAPEIMKQLDGKITHFVSCDKTGSILQGVGTFLKRINPEIKVVLAQTRKDSETRKFPEVAGVKHERKLRVINKKVVDEVIEISEAEKYGVCLMLAETKGILAGVKSGANISVSLKLCKSLLEKTPEKHIVICTTLPDVGLKFLNTIYNKEWMRQFTENNNVYPLSTFHRETAETEIFEKNSHYSKSNFLSKLEAFDIEDLIGGTPLIDLSHLVVNKHGIKDVKLLAKVEFFNPGFSIKDRIVRNILGKAEQDGRLKKGMTVVAASSGNTGAATAMMSAMKGYKCIITTTPKCSKEKMDSIKAYGATLLVSSPEAKEGDPDHYMNMAQDLAANNPGWFDVDQYDNKDNSEAHFLTLAPEIYEQTQGKVTIFVAAGSTGGTVSGCSKYFKTKNKKIKCILADPTGSIFNQYYREGKYGTPGKFLVEGVGKGSIPGCMEMQYLDGVITVDDCEAFKMCDILARKNGILVGGSSGLNIYGALKIANDITEEGQVIVTVLPDSGIKYQSKIFNDKWLQENNVGFVRE